MYVCMYVCMYNVCMYVCIYIPLGADIFMKYNIKQILNINILPKLYENWKHNYIVRYFDFISDIVRQINYA